MIKIHKKNYSYRTNLIYYYFNTSKEPIKAYKDMANPVVMSIATFRKWNRRPKIYVIDVSETRHDWGDWPVKLNFQVHRSAHRAKTSVFGSRISEKNKFCFGMLSKPSCLYEFIKQNIHHHSTVIICDSDVFFLQNPLPLEVDHTRGVCSSLENVGFMYFMNNGYDGGMTDVDKIFELWSGLCGGCLIDHYFKQSLSDRCLWMKEVVQEEVVFWYMQKMFPDLLIKDIPYAENFWFDWPTDAYDVKKVKNLHYRVWREKTKMHRDERGKLCLWVKELRNIVFEVLGAKAINELYDGWDCEEPFSFYDFKAVESFLGPC